jgi:hypothetical protein
VGRPIRGAITLRGSKPHDPPGWFARVGQHLAILARSDVSTSLVAIGSRGRRSVLLLGTGEDGAPAPPQSVALIHRSQTRQRERRSHVLRRLMCDTRPPGDLRQCESTDRGR